MDPLSQQIPTVPAPHKKSGLVVSLLILAVVVLVGVVLYKKYVPGNFGSPSSLTDEQKAKMLQDIANNEKPAYTGSPEEKQQILDQYGQQNSDSSGATISDEQKMQIMQSLQ